MTDTCAKCNGTGRIEHGVNPSDAWTEPCKRCHGTGTVEPGEQALSKPIGEMTWEECLQVCYRLRYTLETTHGVLGYGYRATDSEDGYGSYHPSGYTTEEGAARAAVVAVAVRERRYIASGHIVDLTL